MHILQYCVRVCGAERLGETSMYLQETIPIRQSVLRNMPGSLFVDLLVGTLSRIDMITPIDSVDYTGLVMGVSCVQLNFTSDAIADSRGKSE